MTDLTIAQFILVPVMGKGNKPPAATGEVNFSSAPILGGIAACCKRSCGDHQHSHTKQQKYSYFHQRFPILQRSIPARRQKDLAGCASGVLVFWLSIPKRAISVAKCFFLHPQFDIAKSRWVRCTWSRYADDQIHLKRFL